jgi:hypothetical protein
VVLKCQKIGRDSEMMLSLIYVVHIKFDDGVVHLLGF